MKPRILTLFSGIGTAILLLALVTACGGSAPDAPGPGKPAGSREDSAAPVPLDVGQKPKVVATTSIVADIVRHVGGDRIEITALMGPGIEPHTYVPTPADAAAIHDAHAVFANGAGLEVGLEKVFSASGGQAVFVYLSDGLEFPPTDSAGKADPHAWFSVPNVIQWIGKVQQTLSSLDPDNAQGYEADANAYTRQLEELDAWVKEQVAQIPPAHRILVTNHPVFGHFADRYGLQQLGAVYPASPASEPSAQDLAALQDAIRQYGVPAVFTESTVSPKLAEQVATDTGVQIVPLYTDSLGGPGSGVESYIDLVRYDTNAIVQALR